MFLLRASVLIPLSFATHCDPFVPLPVSLIEKPDDADTLDIIALAAPLFECTDGTKYAQHGLFHGGIGFKNHRTGYSFSVNYDATPISSSVVPAFTKNASGVPVGVYPVNFGAMELYHHPEGIDYKYWSTYAEAIGIVSGRTLNHLLTTYFATFNATFPRYTLAGTMAPPSPYDTPIRHGDAGPTPGTIYTDSFDCFGAMFEVISRLKGCGVVLSQTSVNATRAFYVTSSPPVIVNASTPGQEKHALVWYEAVEKYLHAYPNGSIISDLQYILSLGNAYAIVDTSIVMIKPVAPYVVSTWMEEPFPPPSPVC